MKKIKKFIVVVTLGVLGLGGIGWGVWHESPIGQRFQASVAGFVQNRGLEKGNERLIFWRVYTAMFKDSPIVGQGNFWVRKGVREGYYNKLGYDFVKGKPSAHNVYLEILGTSGLFGLVSLAVLAFALGRRVWRFAKQQQLQGPFLALCIALSANALHGVTQNVFFDATVMYSILTVFFVILWQGAIGFSQKRQ